MQIIRSLDSTDAALVGFGVRVLLLSGGGEDGPMARRLASLGVQVYVMDEMFTALSDVIDDPTGYALFMIDCDSASVGGLEGGQRAFKMLGEVSGRVPVILVSQECREQTFPADRMAPTQLRAPLSAVSMRVGFEHALRERLAYRLS